MCALRSGYRPATRSAVSKALAHFAPAQVLGQRWRRVPRGRDRARRQGRALHRQFFSSSASSYDHFLTLTSHFSFLW